MDARWGLERRTDESIASIVERGIMIAVILGERRERVNVEDDFERLSLGVAVEISSAQSPAAVQLPHTPLGLD